MSPRRTRTPKLAEALALAIKSLTGTSLRDTASEAGREFVTHAQVLRLTGCAMDAHGLKLVPVSLRLVDEKRWSARDGEHTVWVWEQVSELEHVSGESRHVTVQVTAPPHDWGAAPPAKMAERLMLVGLLRLAVDDREPTVDRDAGEQRTGPADRELVAGRVVSQLNRDLAVLKPLTVDTLAAFWADAQKQLREHQANASHHSVVSRTFGDACRRAGLEPDKVVAQGVRA